MMGGINIILINGRKFGGRDAQWESAAAQEPRSFRRGRQLADGLSTNFGSRRWIQGAQVNRQHTY